MNQVAIGVGSNIEPKKNIEKAKLSIQREHQLVFVSTLLQTEPVGFEDQADFMNCAFLVNTEYPFDPFAVFLKDLEEKLGRIRTENKFGPRTIDLDIVVWNGKITDHDFFERAFLRQTILELLPDLKP